MQGGNPLDAQTRALMALTKGDAAFRCKDFAQAAERYTQAVALASEPELVVALLCRRAAAYLYVKRLNRCVEDCNVALAVDPACFRAHVVRCLACIYLCNFVQAAEDHAASSVLTGGNVVLLERLEELRLALDVARSAAVYAATRGGSDAAGAAPAEWIGDFCLLGLEPMEGTKRRREGLPRLIPVGEWLGADVCEPLLDYTPYKLVDKAMREKQKGNAEFAGGNFGRALQLYTRAIKLNPDEALYYSNRALVYIRLQRFEEAIADCSASLARQPTIKAYARRALAYDSLHMHVEAAEDHRAALQFEPRNPVCLNAFRECLEQLLAQATCSAEERARAQRELAEVLSLGRFERATQGEERAWSEDAGGLGPSSHAARPTVVASPAAAAAGAEKKKRAAQVMQ